MLHLTTYRGISSLLPMPMILLTNDDGIHAPGLQALENAFSGLGADIWVVAPHVERSACGRSVTLDRPLRVEQLGERRMAVDGTPADCVLLAFRKLLSARPDAVISGINHGYNVGEDVDYSGTVGAAAEACLQGALVSAAVSVEARNFPRILDGAAEFTRHLIQTLLEHPPPPGCFVNVNLPPDHNKRFRWTRQGNPLPAGYVQMGTDPRDTEYYWIAERPDEDHPPPDTDRGAVRDGCISLSLLTLDRNFHGSWPRPSVARSGFREDGP
jgi:5'-nucleotidase